MKTNDLITTLSKNVKKVEVVRFTVFDVFNVLVIGLLCVLACVAIQGVRVDIINKLSSWTYWAEFIMLFFLGLSSILGAMNLCIPSKQDINIFVFPIISILVLLSIVLYSLIRYSNPTYVLVGGFGCVFEILFSSLLPSVFLFWLARRAVSIKPGKVGFFVALSGLSFGLLSVHISCYDSSPLHILVLHLLPVLIFSIFGLSLGKKILRKI